TQALDLRRFAPWSSGTSPPFGTRLRSASPSFVWQAMRVFPSSERIGSIVVVDAREVCSP
ncbi:MAG: hypothetical protein ACRD26_23895, partial [Vicinamibacterales bacterium]